MKSVAKIKNKEIDWNVTQLLICKDRDRDEKYPFIVLYSGKETAWGLGLFEGTVVGRDPNAKEFKLGSRSDDWCKQSFEVYLGTVTLEN